MHPNNKNGQKKKLIQELLVGVVLLVGKGWLHVNRRGILIKFTYSSSSTAGSLQALGSCWRFLFSFLGILHFYFYLKTN